jgi:hypothetical protein
MRGTVSVIFVICWSLWPAVNSYAQNILIKPFEQHNILLEKDNLLKMRPLEPEKESIRHMQIGIEPDIILIKIKKKLNVTVDREVFNKLYNKPKIDEEKMLREQWKKAFGIDVWYPYYKAKSVERWVKKKLSIKIFKLKGEPQFARNQILYTFKVKF